MPISLFTHQTSGPPKRLTLGHPQLCRVIVGPEECRGGSTQKILGKWKGVPGGGNSTNRSPEKNEILQWSGAAGLVL